MVLPHPITARVYVNVAHRDSDLFWQSTRNLNRVVKVEDTDDYFILASVGPTIWQALAGEQHDTLQLSITGSNPAYTEGLLFYDKQEKVLSFYGSEPDITLNIGEEQWVRVRNNSGSTIIDGQVVYISGAISDDPTIALAKADNISTASTIGFATHDIENNTIGYVTISGVVHGLDTSAFSAGNPLYVSATVAGDVVNTPPTGAVYRVSIGTVTRSHVSSGSVLVHPEQVLPLTVNEFAFLVGQDQALKTTDDVAFASHSVSSLNAAPANATDTGTLGEIRWTTTHIYLCTATNVWVRAALATW